MPAPLSRDLRERIVAAIRDGSSMRGAAARVSVSPSSAIKLMARVRATGSVAPARYRGPPRRGRGVGVGQRNMVARRFVFLDEPGLPTEMPRLYGRSPRGERLVGAVPHGHWRTTTFIAGLRQSGIIAPLVLDGPMTGAAFRA